MKEPVGPEKIEKLELYIVKDLHNKISLKTYDEVEASRDNYGDADYDYQDSITIKELNKLISQLPNNWTLSSDILCRENETTFLSLTGARENNNFEKELKEYEEKMILYKEYLKNEKELKKQKQLEEKRKKLEKLAKEIEEESK